MLKLKNSVAAAVVVIFWAGFGDALPTSFTQSHIAQHLFGGGWFNSAKSDAYQVCSRENTPGVGFELTAKYATASVKYENGTIIDIGQVDGSIDYEETMANLLKADPMDHGPPFDTVAQRLKYEYRQALRESRKMLGLPATKDIGNIATMISVLKLSTESILGYSIDSAIVVLPGLSLLPMDDLEDVYKIAGITYVLTPWSDINSIGWIYAANAGMGRGLCKTWQDQDECSNELLQLPSKETLSVSFDRDALRVANVEIKLAYENAPLQLSADYTLAYSNSHALEFWDNLTSRITQYGKGLDQKIQQIVVMGEHAEEKQFLDSLWKALHELEESGNLDDRAADIYSTIQVPGLNTLYLGARGAAEIALEWQGEVEKCVEVTPQSAKADQPKKLQEGISIGKIDDHLVEVGSMSISSVAYVVTVKICVATGQRKEDGGRVDIETDQSMTFWGVNVDLVKDAVKQAPHEAGDRAWEIITVVWGPNPHTELIIFEADSAIGKRQLLTMEIK